MSRTLHIAISDAGGCCHSDGHHGGAGYGSHGLGDPGDGEKTAKLEDPGDGEKTAKLEDPGDGEKTAKLEDPKFEDPGDRRGHGGGGGCGCGCGSPQWHSVPLGCGEGAAEQTAQQASAAALGPLEYSGFIILRLAHGWVVPDSPETLWELAFEKEWAGLQAALRTDNLDQGETPPDATTPPLIEQDAPPSALRSRPLIDLATSPTCRLTLSDSRNSIAKLEAKAAHSNFRPLHSLNSYWRIDARHLSERAEELVNRFNALPEVDLAYREMAATDPRTDDPTTEAYADAQDYLDLAPVGIAARWALKELTETDGKNSARRLVDLERGWIYQHRELAGKVSPVPLVGENRHGQLGYEGHHGTAVLGQLCAHGIDLNSLLADSGDVATASHYKGDDHETDDPEEPDYAFPRTDGHVAEGIFAVLHVGLGVGDVLLLEVQRGRFATEVDFADLDAMRLATALGVVVVEAAGNRGASLDSYVDEQSSRRLDRSHSDFVDSGAVVVGAAEPELPHDRAAFSNYGSRIDCYGWGRTVLSCGYGDFEAGATGDIHEFYTNTFNGTSSASPIVAGAAVLLLCLYQQRGGQGASEGAWLSPLRVRALLSDPQTGTPQGPGVYGRIGVMPDLRAILEGRLGLVADPHLRRFVGEEQCDAPDGPVSCCPDIVVTTTAQNDPALWGPDSRSENFLAPGGAVFAPQVHELFVRLCNRGLKPAEQVQIQLYCAEPATLLTPELWHPISASFKAEDLKPGGAWKVADPVRWDPASFPSPKDRPAPERFAFMAIFAAGNEPPPPPPPGPPYFDWATFLRFQRASHVGCRNVHWIELANDDPIELPFLVTGAPDRSRTFDFEIVRNLPPGVHCELSAPRPLIARWHQRRPWLHRGYPDPSLRLPAERRLTLSRILVPARARYCATLEISKLAEIQTGQSLAIRQLYGGREVGRITWLFESP